MKVSTIENNRPNRPDRPVNPWHERARERQRRWGGQYRASQTDRLSDAEERWLEFEHARLTAANDGETVPW